MGTGAGCRRGGHAALPSLTAVAAEQTLKRLKRLGTQVQWRDTLKKFIASLAIAAAAATSQAEIITYDFTGITNVGGSSHTFTGQFQYQNAAPSVTVYFPGQTAPVQQGFQSIFSGAVVGLSITLNNGESVSGALGYIANNNIQQAENGAQVPAGQSLQAYSSGAAGTINGLEIRYLYLAFLPVDPNFSWDALDGYFNGNAETMLANNPALLPGSIDPTLTGTALPADLLSVFSGGLFLGTVHGNTTTVNTITSFTLHVPSPSAGLALLLPVALGARRRR